MTLCLVVATPCQGQRLASLLELQAEESRRLREKLEESVRRADASERAAAAADSSAVEAVHALEVFEARAAAREEEAARERSQHERRLAELSDKIRGMEVCLWRKA